MHCKPFCSITCGFSGAGAFSDGKVNYYHLATGVPDNLYMGGNDGPSFRQALSVDEIKSLFACAYAQRRQPYKDRISLRTGSMTQAMLINPASVG
mgnify:CR=1 FL=1